MAALGARALVSVMAANNETGVVQPVSQAARLVHSAGSLLHVDAVQAAGRIACDITAMGADLLTLSAHKIGGPKGVGALIGRTGVDAFTPLITGGGQERGARAGTENVAGIAGFGAAAAAARAGLVAEAARMVALRDRLETGLKAATPEVLIFGVEAERLPNTTLFAAPGMKAETAVIALDLEGAAISAGAACSSGRSGPRTCSRPWEFHRRSPAPPCASSLGPTTMDSDVDRFIEAWIKVSGSLLRQSQGIAA